jgi:phospholipid/cholesterol/gamma-HCH transport system ATP-binding protein
VLAEQRVIAVGSISELVATRHPWIEDYFLGPRGRAAASAREAVAKATGLG